MAPYLASLEVLSSLSGFVMQHCYTAIVNGILSLAAEGVSDFFSFKNLLNASAPFLDSTGVSIQQLASVLINDFLASIYQAGSVSGLNLTLLHNIMDTGTAIIGSYGINGIDVPWLTGSLLSMNENWANELVTRIVTFSR